MLVASAKPWQAADFRMAQTPHTLQPRCLVFDLETVPQADDGRQRIIKIGALRPDTGEALELNTGAALDAALGQLDAMCAGASFVLGHNVLAHDLPVLREVAPDSALFQLPVIDTLRLSPLAFPQNPYHRLIKDYKLIRDSLNSPLSDCRSTLALFADQQSAFDKLFEANPEELLCYQALIAPRTGAGLGNFLFALTRRAPWPLEDVAGCLPALLAESDPGLERELKVCRTRLKGLIEDDLRRPELHWPIAYVLAWLRVSGGNSVLAPWVRHQFPAVGKLITELREDGPTPIHRTEQAMNPITAAAAQIRRQHQRGEAVRLADVTATIVKMPSGMQRAKRWRLE